MHYAILNHENLFGALKETHGVSIGGVRDILLSTFGAMVAGFLINLLVENRTGGLDRYSLFVAAGGALVFLITYHGMIRHGRSPWEVTLVERFRRRRKGRSSINSDRSHSKTSIIRARPAFEKAQNNPKSFSSASGGQAGI